MQHTSILGEYNNAVIHLPLRHLTLSVQELPM